MSLKIQNKKSGNLFILSGPSGVGKTTLREALQARRPGLRFSVSWTTRSPRPGEVKGQDYRFVSQKQFETNLKAEGFLEWARVHEAYYGTPKAPIQRWLAKGEDVLLDIDIQGANQVKKRIPQAIAIFILPPSWLELKKRLIDRRTDSPQTIRVRLKNAEKELQAVKRFDYAVINKEIVSSVDTMETILKAARFRVQTQ
ncbi:MAG: guanylate kinase [Deltaproteobacteria bacterium]|nr:guanylate kinase [Deltaproteobacteria bacterium]